MAVVVWEGILVTEVVQDVVVGTVAVTVVVVVEVMVLTVMVLKRGVPNTVVWQVMVKTGAGFLHPALAP